MRGYDNNDKSAFYLPTALFEELLKKSVKINNLEGICVEEITRK